MSRQRLKKAGRFIYHGIPQGGGIIAILASAAITILITAGVAMRYFVKASYPWVDEFTAFLVLLIAVMGWGYTFRKGSHFRVTVAVNMLPWQIRNFLWIPICLVAMFFIVYLGYATTQVALKSLSKNSVTLSGALPLFPLQLCVPIGLFLLFVPLLGFTIKRFVVALQGRRDDEIQSE